MNLFSNQASILAEGPIWHSNRNSLFWVDIINKVLYEKAFFSKNELYDHQWELPYICSSLSVNGHDNDKLYLLTEHSLGEFCLLTGEYIPKVKLNMPEGYRTNDGGIAPDGSFWFGTMQKKPTDRKGMVFSISPKGGLSKQLDYIGIPNTFCWSNIDCTLFLADSFRQQLFSYSNKDGKLDLSSEQIFVDLSESSVTPDGGAMDLNNRLWNAQWNGGRAVCYDLSGNILHHIDMPVPQPSSCCFGGPENKYLFITTAKEGMTDQELEIYPMSGMVFLVKLETSGFPIKPFYLEDIEEC